MVREECQGVNAPTGKTAAPEGGGGFASWCDITPSFLRRSLDFPQLELRLLKLLR